MMFTGALPTSSLNVEGHKVGRSYRKMLASQQFHQSPQVNLVTRLQSAISCTQVFLEGSDSYKIRAYSDLLGEVTDLDTSQCTSNQLNLASQLYGLLSQVSNNPYPFGIYLRLLGKHGGTIEEAQSVVQTAIEQNALTWFVASVYLDTAVRISRSIEDCNWIFNKLTDKEQADHLYSVSVLQLYQLNLEPRLRQAIDTLKKDQCCDSDFISYCNELFKTVYHFSMVDDPQLIVLAEELYNELSKVSSDPQIFLAYLKMLGSYSKDMQKISTVFDQVLAKKALDPCVLFTYLETAWRVSQQIDPLIRAFTLAMKHHTPEVPCVDFKVCERFVNWMKLHPWVRLDDTFKEMREREILSEREVQVLELRLESKSFK